ncbi:MAG: carbohydrate kinase family protein [Clostridia bacterium]|nr:carbohydrate kinase family protein [Clostridia bacterium]
MSNKVFVSHGDIILDKVYDGDLNLIKEDGGGSNWNTLYNLAYMGEDCYAIGSCGDDEEGRIALDSLRKCGVNTDYIQVDNISTDVMNIIIPNSELGDDTIIHSWYSPITNERTLEFRNNLPINLPSELSSKEVFVLLDKFEKVNLNFLNNIENKKVCLDIGHYRFIEHFSKQYLTEFFKNANLVQLNNNVCDLLFERLQVKNEFELFDLLGLDLLVITKGKKGAAFIFKENNEFKMINQSPEIIAKVLDSCGAGDAFFATLIKEYAYAEKIDSDFISHTFSIANKASRDVISQLGSRRV